MLISNMCFLLSGHHWSRKDDHYKCKEYLPIPPVSVLLAYLVKFDTVGRRILDTAKWRWFGLEWLYLENS